MTTTLLNPDVAQKSASKAKKKQSAMTYEQAVAIMLECDEQIRNAGKIRTHTYIKTRHSLKFHTFLKTGAVMGVTDASMLTFLPPETMTNGLFLILVAGTLALPMLSVHLPRRIMGMLSPFKAKTENKQQELAQAFYDLKEDHFTEMEAKILKKAQPAMDVINGTIAGQVKGQYQEIVYARNNFYMDSYFGLQTSTNAGFTCTTPLGTTEEMSVESIITRGERIRKPYMNAITG